MASHRFDAGYRFGRHSRRISLTRFEYAAPQFDDPISHDNIDQVAGPEALPLQLGEHAASNRLVAVRAGRDFGRNACQRPQQVGAADNPDEPAAAHDGHSFDSTFFHEIDDIAELCVLGDGLYVARHDVIDPAGVRMDIVPCKPAGSEDELQPSRSLPLGAGLGAAQKIAFRHNADNDAAGVHNGQAADPVVQHQP
jgi:hypothetical protein